MATAKQIAWRKKFAAMAKAGTLRKRKTTKNPIRRKRKVPPKIAVTARSRATGKPPSRRLKARRAVNTRPGVYPNPRKRSSAVCYAVVDPAKPQLASNFIAEFKSRANALEYAKALATKYGKQYGVLPLRK